MAKSSNILAELGPVLVDLLVSSVKKRQGPSLRQLDLEVIMLRRTSCFLEISNPI